MRHGNNAGTAGVVPGILRMRATSITAALCACLVLVACAPAEPPRPPPAPTSGAISTPPPAATPTSEPVAEPAPPATTAATSEPAPAAASSSDPDLVDSPGDTRLQPAADLVKAGQHAGARAELEKVLPDIDKTGSLDAKMAAHALLGRTCAALSDEGCAAGQYEIVRAFWKDPAAAAKQIDAAGGDEKVKLEHLRRALNAAGEALFHAAEVKRRAAEEVRFPAYTGKGDKDRILKHINTRVASWMKTRRARIEEANNMYSNIAQLQPAPPPRWVVASAARVGQMWGRFAAEFRAAPIPAQWKGAGLVPGTNVPVEEVRAHYYAAVDEASEPQRELARAAFKKCQDLSQKYGVEDGYSKSCDAWLAKNPAPAAAP